jgi:Uma2 family endonuclease
MTTVAATSTRARIVYPETDGAPIAENTLQYEWITTIKGGLDHLFAGAPDVFVAGDLFWYPVEGRPEIVAAPDAMVAFGRPKGHRRSYLQWEEDGVAPQVAFEVLSPANRRHGVMVRKFDFYRRYGVEEYYVYDPDLDRLDLSGFVRQGDELVEVATMNGHVSPRLGVRFEMGEDGLRIVRPDGRLFLSYADLAEREEEQRQRAEQALGEVEKLRQQLRVLGQDPTG